MITTTTTLMLVISFFSSAFMANAGAPKVVIGISYNGRSALDVFQMESINADNAVALDCNS